MNTEDHAIENWQDVDGYVHVNGERVLGAFGSKGVQVQKSIALTCGLCAIRGDGHYTAPAVLMGRFEHALGRPMYYFSAAHLCRGCTQARRFDIPLPVEAE